MSYQTVSVVAKDVKTNKLILNDKISKTVGTIKFKDDSFVFNPPLLVSMPELPTAQKLEATEQQLPLIMGGFTGTIDGVYPSLEINNVNYIPSEKKFYYSESPGYLAQTLGPTGQTGSGGKMYISNYSIVPKIDALENYESGLGLSLGSSESYWKSIYVNELNFISNTMYVTDPKTRKTMKITNDPNTLQTFITNDNITVKTITTSQNIPNVIDPEYLPFTGMNFMSNFNPYTYSQVPTFDIDGNPSFGYQTIYLLQTLNYDQITQIDLTNLKPKTNTIFQKLSGAYYLVKDIPSNIDFVELDIPNIEATTDLISLNKSLAGNVTSSYTIKDSKLTELRNNDMIMLTLSLYKDTITNAIKILAQWNVVNFRVPINGINTSNIEDNAITNSKLVSGCVSYDKLDTTVQGKIDVIDSYTNRISELETKTTTIGFDVLDIQSGMTGITNSIIQNSEDINTLTTQLSESLLKLSKANSYINNLENRVLALEEFVNIFLKTNVIDYYASDVPVEGEVPLEYAYTGSSQNMVPDAFNISFFNVITNTTEKKLKIKLKHI